ncbi:vacuolar H+ ATPase F subunit [Reticulomyxa filosa]|uniref:Vacuolar H+ ATPase F subunit n=1 Tax=Reticulomyxa filosa TaxID=46433 RepID=X6MLC5_RETFI|nr:vacuolar H+ ATPase F subunit [Reticulomyxa filosa]|eukprot:ETO14257.1 vacuolar H+ ATPase F subunit [Reticulomyxa filosa]
MHQQYKKRVQILIFPSPKFLLTELPKPLGFFRHMARRPQTGQLLIGIIADENKNLGLFVLQDTVTGFLLAGIGDRNRKGQRNFLAVTGETQTAEIEAGFKDMTQNREDIGILLITQQCADQIRHLLSQYAKPLPTVLEIPSKNQEYDPDKDDIMIRVKRLLGKG